MKTFDDRYQAWLEGRLSPEEAAAFERELPEVSAEQCAESERELAPLSRLLKQGTTVPPLTGGDFFNYQLLEKLRQEEEAARPAQPAPKEKRHSIFPWTFTNLAWSGVCAALAAIVVYQAWVHPKGEPLTAKAPVVEEKPLVSAAAPPREPNAGVQVASTAGQNPSPTNLRATDEPAQASGQRSGAGAGIVATAAGTRAAILTTYTADPKVSAKSVQTDGDGVAIQLEGVEALPANFLLK